MYERIAHDSHLHRIEDLRSIADLARGVANLSLNIATWTQVPPARPRPVSWGHPVLRLESRPERGSSPAHQEIRRHFAIDRLGVGYKSSAVTSPIAGSGREARESRRGSQWYSIVPGAGLFALA